MHQNIIIAVVVTYHPEEKILAALLGALAPQVREIVVVDNGQAQTSSLLMSAGIASDKISVLALGENYGVAAAQNRGIAVAKRKGATHVLLLDHDSIPAPDMVEKLFEAVENLTGRGLKVAAVGPRYRFPDTDHYSYFVRFGKLRFKKIYCSGEDGREYIPVDFLISSGCLIPCDALNAVGQMDESLFIDHVDTDWFLRARYDGYAAFGVCSATMDHQLGDGLFHLGFGTKKKLPIHSPLRLYYIFRNSILLYRRAYAPDDWKVNDLVRLCHPRKEYIKMMARGIRDGIKCVTGRYKA